MKDQFFDLREKIQHKIQPIGALGLLEKTAQQVGCIQGRKNPEIRHPHLVVFAGDHGITESGMVNPFPQTGTAQMVHNLIRGEAAIRVYCRQHQITLKIADAGVKTDLSELHQHPAFIPAKIAPGTRNYLEEPAMSFEETERAIAVGRVITGNIAATGCNTIAFGEMGISNSYSASLLMAAFLNLPLEKCVEKSAGDNQISRKLETLQTVLDLHRSLISLRSPLKTLQYLGGYEIAMMVGAYLAAAEHKMTIVVDGFISGAALLVARELKPTLTDNCIFGHCSGELGHRHLLHHFDARPLLNLGLRMSEGTGAALAIPLVQSAVLLHNEMAGINSLRATG